MTHRVNLLLTLLYVSIYDTANVIATTEVIQQHFRRTPDNQTATINETVTLACSIINKQGVLQWTRDGFGLGTDRDLSGYERYRMVGVEEEGDYTLVIDHVTLEDDAIFQCQVGPGENGATGLRSANAKLTVEVPSGTPSIVQGEFLYATEGRRVQIECISKGGKPAAEVTWLDGTGQEIKSNISVIKELLDNRKSYNTRSILTLTPRKDDNNKTFTCQAHNHPSKEVMSALIKVNVKYSPRISIKVYSQNIKEYDDVRISCTADGNPSGMNYRWFLNNHVLIDEYSNLLVLNNISRIYDNSTVKCEVSNTVGKSDQSETLSIHYGPIFQQSLKNVQAEPNSSVTLSCDVDGNPRPEIVWFYEETRIVVSTSANFTFLATPETVGKYICQAAVEGFAEISAESNVHLKGPPKFQGPKIQLGREDDLVRLECYALSIPRANSIIWSHNGANIVPDNIQYRVKEDFTSDGVRSTLLIKSSKEADFGSYNCTVANQYGTRVMEIFLMKQKNPHLVIMLTVAIAGVVLIVALAMLSLLCQGRKSTKSEMMGSYIGELEKSNIQTIHKSDTASNNSDLKIEILTASSLSNSNGNESEDYNNSDVVHIRNDSFYRFNDYIDHNAYTSSKIDGHTNNGYISYGISASDKNSPDSSKSKNVFQLGDRNTARHKKMATPNYYHVVHKDPRYIPTYSRDDFTRMPDNNFPLPPYDTTDTTNTIASQYPQYSHSSYDLSRKTPPRMLQTRSNAAAPQVPQYKQNRPSSLTRTHNGHPRMKLREPSSGTLATHV